MKKKVELTLVKRYWGLFSENQSETTVSSLEEAQNLAVKDPDCLGYFVDQREIIIVNGKSFYAEKERVKSVLFGKLFTLKQIEKMHFFGKYEVIQAMVKSKTDRIVKSRTIRWIPLLEEEISEMEILNIPVPQNA